MYKNEPQELSNEFLACWRSAELHLDNQVQSGEKSWLRAHLYPPFSEHLSFHLGNQFFFVRIEDVERNFESPGSLNDLLSIADSCGGHACLMPMKKTFLGGWETELGGWGLIDARTKMPVNPFSLVTDEKIEMTAQELQDSAVQIVRERLENDGYEILYWQGNPNVDPAILFVGNSKGPEYVVLRVVKYPQKDAPKPENWTAIQADCSKLSRIGHFASVGLVSWKQQFLSDDEVPVPLWRGDALLAKYKGLERNGG